jgi:hypothetical protein
MAKIRIAELADAAVGAPPVTFPEFSSVADLLRELPDRGVGVLWGVAVYEELNYFSANYGITYSADPIINGKKVIFSDIARRSAEMYAKSRYKVDSFLGAQTAARPVIKRNGEFVSYADVLDFAADINEGELIRYVHQGYVNSRRVKDGLENDIAAYFSALKSIKVSGDVVIMTGRYLFTWAQLILLWLYFHGHESRRLVILVSGGEPRWVGSSAIISVREREYIDVDDFLKQAAGFFKRRMQVLRTAFGIWSRGISSISRVLIKDGRLTEGLADQFLTAFAQSAVGDESGTESIGVLVPSQKPAPLRFQSSMTGLIDIIDEREFGPGNARIVGAARVCLSAIDDLKEYMGFSNAIPNFGNKLGRVEAVLRRMEIGEYDDNLVVQLGTELSSLHQRISVSSDMIGESGFAEASAFFAVANGLLSQFRIWVEYKNKIDRSSDEKAVARARDVLELARVRDGIATGRARSRVSDYMDGFDLSNSDKNGSELAKDGAILVAENIVSQAAGRVAELVRTGSGVRVEELVKTLDGVSGDRVVIWFWENRNEIYQFADENDIGWLKAFLSSLELSER